jgi:hypothetical protein
MPVPLPFSVSPEAEEWLAQISSTSGSQPGISYTLGYDSEMNGQIIEEFWGEHYSIGFDSAERWVSVHSAVRFSIAGREFWLEPKTIDTLRGKTLVLVQREVGRGKYAGKVRELLVAA